MHIINKVVSSHPIFELTIRRLYYSNNIIIRALSKRAHSIQKRNVDNKSRVDEENYKEDIFEYIKGLGIEKGDILILHTSEDKLSEAGIGPNELFDFIRLLIGDEGTLVIPAYPLYNEKNFDNEKGKYIYNPKRTLCTTGMIPNLFLRLPHVVRSLYPWNTLAAQGPEAELMMKDNLNNNLAYGIGSAWEYCYNRRAKILLLGVKASHTTSMVHTAEDLMDDKWPIMDWYETKTIYINSPSFKGDFTVRLRKPEWAKYNASWYRSAQFVKENILKEEMVRNLNIAYVEDSKKMVDYIIERNKKHKGFFVVPTKYFKKGF